MAFEKLLHITNTSEASDAVVQRIAGLRNIGLEEVIFFHLSNGGKWKDRLGSFGIQTKNLTVDGPMIPSLLNAARQEGVSFISTNVEDQNKGIFRRPYAKDLIKASPVPVMFMPKDDPSIAEEKGVFDHVIFGTDWSESCQEVMRYLLKFKGIIKELEIVHVVEKRLSIKEMRELRYRLSAWRNAFLDHSIDAESHIYAGRTHEEILLATQDYRGTCVIMGTSVKSSIKKWLESSCSFRVAEGSSVPTIIVPL
jgi:nucleotide-binding universal stress UspA family protein